MLEAFCSFIFDDFVKVGLQFYYFGKFLFLPCDVLVHFNGIFMLLKVIELETSNIIRWKSKDNDKEKFRFFVKHFNISQCSKLYSLYKSFQEKTCYSLQKRWILGFIFTSCITLYPLARAARAFYQSARGNAYVKVSKLKSKSPQN